MFYINKPSVGYLDKSHVNMMLIIHLYHLIKYKDNIPICTIGTIFG